MPRLGKCRDVHGTSGRHRVQEEQQYTRWAKWRGDRIIESCTFKAVKPGAKVGVHIHVTTVNQWEKRLRNGHTDTQVDIHINRCA